MGRKAPGVPMQGVKKGPWGPSVHFFDRPKPATMPRSTPGGYGTVASRGAGHEGRPHFHLLSHPMAVRHEHGRRHKDHSNPQQHRRLRLRRRTAAGTATATTSHHQPPATSHRNHQNRLSPEPTNPPRDHLKGILHRTGAPKRQSPPSHSAGPFPGTCGDAATTSGSL